MRIAVLTDTHANLPALEAALAEIEQLGCDAVYHTGDAIAIGPHPAECLDLLLSVPRIRLTMGNHDAYFAQGLPDPHPEGLSDGEAEHQHWVHSCLDPSLRDTVARWPFLIDEEIEGVRVRFIHYALDPSQKDFLPIVRDPTPDDLDQTFTGHSADLVFYGHHHPASDIQGQARYVNPGSLGCHTEAVARFSVLQCSGDTYELEKHAVPYDDAALVTAFAHRHVPEREFISKVFFGERFV